MNEQQWKAALETLRRRGSDADKDALLARLRAERARKATWRERFQLMWERAWPQVRLPAYGTGFAASLALIIGLGVFYSASPIMAPQIDDLEFAGSSAVVIESTTAPATLIWLSEADDDNDDEDEDDEEDI